MNKVLMTMKSESVVKILNGEQTIIPMNTAPKNELPIEIYLYCKQGDRTLRRNAINGHSDFYANKGYGDVDLSSKIVAKFILKKVEEIRSTVKLGMLLTYNTYETDTLQINPLLDKCCMVYDELDSFLKMKTGYAWHISDLEIFDEPKELNEFVDEVINDKSIFTFE